MFISLSPSLFLVSLFEHRFLLHSVVYYPLIVRAPRTGFLRNPARRENLASGMKNPQNAVSNFPNQRFSHV